MTLTPLVSTQTLLPYILPDATGCPSFVAEFEARKAVIEFCERTRCWRHVVSVTLDAESKAIVAPDNTTIHEFEKALLDGVELTPTQFTAVDSEELYGTEITGPAKYISQIEPGQVLVHPSDTGTLRVSCFLKPKHGQSMQSDADNPISDAYNVFPAFMLAQYADSLAAGALSAILFKPNKPYTDYERAAVFRAKFEAACNGAFQSNIRGQQRAPLRVKPNWL